jgi:A/G-specific adenine glycosylase
VLVTTSPAAQAGFGVALGEWSTTNRRDLPWRRTRDPWAVLVAEAMLQQTQVARVALRYEPFLARFPSPAATADAPLRWVVAEWAGLGYNRRAVQLHRAATAVVERHGGRLPDDLEALQALPGVGPYTARAVLAFAFGRDVGVVDTNAARVLARAVAGRRLSAGEAQRLADAVVPAGEGWAWNQAMLDLGATVCRTRNPACGRCPVAPHCAWARAGLASPDPMVASAGTARPQSSFAGSDRQGRGRLVAALRAGPLAPGEVATAAGWPEDAERAWRVVATLIGDGLAEQGPDGRLRLPE